MSADKSNRARILEVALRLFNESGTAAISTNHIAASLEISPGNLYYHFRNKQAIIRELYRTFLAEYEQLWSSLARGPLGFLQIVDVIVEGFVVNWKYQFIARELGALCQVDDELATVQREAYEVRFNGIVAVIHQAVQSGVFLPDLESVVIEDIVHVEWMINQYWLPYVEVRGTPPTMVDMLQGARLGLKVIAPYLAGQYRELLFDHLELSILLQAAKTKTAASKSPKNKGHNPKRNSKP